VTPACSAQRATRSSTPKEKLAFGPKPEKSVKAKKHASRRGDEVEESVAGGLEDCDAAAGTSPKTTAAATEPVQGKKRQGKKPPLSGQPPVGKKQNKEIKEEKQSPCSLQSPSLSDKTLTLAQVMAENERLQKMLREKEPHMVRPNFAFVFLLDHFDASSVSQWS